jgi:hypothetical protein
MSTIVQRQCYSKGWDIPMLSHINIAFFEGTTSSSLQFYIELSLYYCLTFGSLLVRVGVVFLGLA